MPVDVVPACISALKTLTIQAKADIIIFNLS